jgi:NAD(P)H dehydrogenase (quinone)
MKISEHNSKPRVLVLGASGLTGNAIASILDNEAADIEVVRAARNKEKVEMWKRDGKQAVYLDLDDARTFPGALQGIDRLFLLTGYTIAMLHQSKTIVDAAADSGVSFIVHQGVFGNGRSTEPHFAWHEMIERYIEGSGVVWAHLHPNFFMQNILSTLGLPNGQEAAAILSETLGRPIAPVVMTPSDLLAAFASGAAKSPPGMEENYAKSQLEWVQQTYDGRMDYGAVATSTVQDLLGRPAMTLRDWVPRHREELLAAASS